MNDLFAAIYENGLFGFYSTSDFSQEVFNLYLYQKYGLILVISVILTLLLYYKGMDKPRFSKLSYWFLMLAFIVTVNFLYTFIDGKVVLEAQGYNYDEEYSSLATVQAIYSFLLFALLSCGIKFISVNNSKIPF